MNDDEQYQSAQDALGNLSDSADESANVISRAFDKVGKDISKSLASAAQSGELSIKNLAKTILGDLSSIAIKEFVTTPITNAVSSIATSVASYGARAGGGNVNTGGAYLVGENGPELFVPNNSGRIENSLSQPVNITINMAQGNSLSEVKRSAGQVTTALARAVSRGRNGL